MKGVALRGIAIVWLCLVFATRAAAQGRAGVYDVYYVAIGSARYAAAPGDDLRGFGDILGAGKSARLVGDILAGGGAHFGIVLTSSPGRFVSQSDIDAALDAVAGRIAKDRPQNPILVFYFAGHGVSEGVGWNLFAIPGNIVTKGDPARLSIENLAGVTVHAASLVDRLEKLKLPFLVVFDTCYEGKAARFQSPVLSAQTSDTLTTASSALQMLNQFPGPDPVLFAAAAGNVVPTVPDPRDTESDYLAPLARRFLLVRNADKSEMTLGQLIDAVRNPSLDRGTKPPVTFATRDAAWSKILLGKEGSPGPIEPRTGSATAASICCDPPAAAVQQAMQGVVDIVGSPGEFISDGATLQLTRGVTAIEPGDRNAIRLEIVAPAGIWTVQFAAPDGKDLASGVYPAARRWPFQEANEPGLAIDGPGRSCNTVEGSFRILDLARSPATITNLSFEADQICDGGPAHLKLRGRLHAAP